MSPSPTLFAGTMGGLVLGGALGWMLKPPPATLVSAPEPVAAPLPSPVPPAPVVTRTVQVSDACAPELEALTAEVSARDAQIHDLETMLYGTPLIWTDDIPDDWREEAFRETLAAVAEECGGSGQLQEVDCSEPPCMAVYMGGSAGAGADCAAWNDRYGIATSQSTRTIECPDGRSMKLQILSPPPKKYHTVDEMMAASRDPTVDPVDQENAHTRIQHRWESLAMDVPCPE